jgi:hypothetical protein
MDAVLDTNIIAHTYSTGHQSLLLDRFDMLYAHACIVDVELAHHASPQVIAWFRKDVQSGRIRILGDRELNTMGMLSIYRWHFGIEDAIYSNPTDKGEARCISLARTLGASALLTDDWKDGGPYRTLLMDARASILPFTFYELLLLDYLDGILLQPQDLETSFSEIAASFQMPPRFRSCMSRAFRRFMQPPKPDDPMDPRSFEWMKERLDDKAPIGRDRAVRLGAYLKTDG